MNVAFAVLVLQLGAPEFRVREAAHQALSKCDHAYYHLLAGERDKDPERSRRCKILLGEWHKRHAETLASWSLRDFGSCPWICPYTQPGRFLADAQKTVGVCGPPEWQDWRLATRLLVIDMHARREGEGVGKILELFAKEEAAYKS